MAKPYFNQLIQIKCSWRGNNSKNNFEYKLLDSYCNNTNNIIYIDLKLQNINLEIINIYGPWFYENLNNIVNNNELDHTIICGDFNLVLNSDMHCYNYKTTNNPRAHAHLIDMISQQNLKDIFHPSIRWYTWRCKTPIRQARLDYFLIFF